MFIPAKFREGLGEGFVVCRWLYGKCLYAFPNEEFDAFSAGIKNLPLGNASAITVQRFLYANAVDVEMDAQRRILIPANLRDFAELKKEVVVAGVSNRVEIWDKALWNDEQQRINEQEVQAAVALLNQSGFMV